MEAPRRPDTSTRLLAWIVVLAACKSPSTQERKPVLADATSGVPVDAPVAVAADAAAPADANPNRLTISVVPPRTPGQGFAKRCAIGGDPLGLDCRATPSFALGADGTLFLATGRTARRYRLDAGEPCKLEPAGAAIELPPDNPRPQSIDGPLYMRSGDARWSLYAAGPTVYAHDFLGGLFRIDRGKAEPACVDVFGYRSLARLGKRLLVGRNGIEELVLRGKGACTARSARIDDKARDELYAIGDHLYTAGNELHRYDGKTRVRLAESTRVCAITAMTACGDGACALDHNCPQIVQLGPDGSVLRTIDDAQLFDARPYSLRGATTAPDGTVYLLATHRDRVGDRDVCEAAVYAVPGAVFAR